MFQEHVDALTVKDLRAALRNAGLQNGPITASTESVYRLALVKYLKDRDNETDQNSTLSSCNSNLESVDTEGESDGEINDPGVYNNVAAQQEMTGLPTITNSAPPCKHTPIRWNFTLQRYEAVYGAHGGIRNNDGDEPHSVRSRKCLLLVGVAVLFLAVTLGAVFLSGDHDPYKYLEDAANRVKTQELGVPK